MKEPVNYPPAISLRPFIAGYGILEIPEDVNEPYFSPPLGLSGFILQTINTSNTVIAKIDGRDFFTENAVATGQVTVPVYGQLIGRVKSVMVFFQPLGMYQLFGTNMATLTNKSMSLDDFLDVKRAGDLMQKLRDVEKNEEQVKVLDDFFSEIVPRNKNVDRLQRILNYIHENKGGVSVSELHDHGHYHPKTLERNFKLKIGLTPKVYTQIYQFKSLINLLQGNPCLTWAQLADEAGYYDQSHMSRYVKEYLKVSPNSIVKLDMDFINYLLKR